MEAVDSIAASTTDRNDRPETEVVIKSVTITES
jgi:hypothetical protein